MQIQSVHSFNLAVSFKNHKVYYLYDLAKNYHLLSSEEQNLLAKNNFPLEKLQSFEKDLLKVRSAVTVDDINGHEIVAQKSNYFFEISDTCKLLWYIFFHGIRQKHEHFELTADMISIENVKNSFQIAKERYEQLKKAFAGAEEGDFYKSKTLDKLYTAKYKVNPLKTEKGYLTAVINNETGEPENVYVKIQEEKNRLSINLLNYNDYDKHPRARFVDSKCSRNYRCIGFLDSKYDSNGDIILYNIHEGDSYSSEEYSGVAYRLIQTLIEYSIQKNKNITVDNADMLLPLYTKAGFRVNCEKDRLMDENDHVLVNMLQDFEKQYDIPQKQLKAVLKKRSKDGVSGFGEFETYINFCELLYQKNKYIYDWRLDCNLELTPQAKKEWLERIRLQPILI